jgi:hypothetical protein
MRENQQLAHKSIAIPSLYRSGSVLTSKMYGNEVSINVLDGATAKGQLDAKRRIYFMHFFVLQLQ